MWRDPITPPPSLWIGPERHAIPHRLVDGVGGHVIRVQVAVVRVHATGAEIQNGRLLYLMYDLRTGAIHCNATGKSQAIHSE
jgi:hypothetical protein